MSPIFTFILSSNIPLSFPIASMLISRHIMPSEVSDGQEDEHCCVDAGREQKGHKVQFHLRVMSCCQFVHSLRFNAFRALYGLKWAKTRRVV